MIEINARQIGGLIVVVGDYIKDLQPKRIIVDTTVNK